MFVQIVSELAKVIICNPETEAQPLLESHRNHPWMHRHQDKDLGQMEEQEVYPQPTGEEFRDPPQK